MMTDADINPPTLPQAPSPVRKKANYFHLYADIAWYGILAASSISFITVYMVRIGANAFQIGLLNASPAVLAILLAIPAGWWLRNKPVDRAVFWTSVFFRIFYAVWIALPVLFLEQIQIWLVIGITLVMSIPGTVLAVGFNAMFADAVPPEDRGKVVGLRNAVLALAFIVTSLVCGYLLDTLVFPLNYQVVFGMGFVGAMMSSYHLHRVRITAPPSRRTGKVMGDFARPGVMRFTLDSVRVSVALRYLTRWKRAGVPSFRVLRGAFGPVLGIMFLFHFSQHLGAPLFPIYWVDRLDLPDQIISLGNALFYATVFIGSTQLARVTKKLNHHGVFVAGAILMAAYPGFTALAVDYKLILVASVLGGFSWALAGGAIGNYLLEAIPADDRPVYLAWYTVAANIAVLGASLAGPALAEWVGLSPALFITTLSRLFAAYAIWQWGRLSSN